MIRLTRWVTATMVLLALGFLLSHGWGGIPPVSASDPQGSSAPEPVVELPGRILAPGDGKLTLRVLLPPDYKFTPEAPCQVKLSSSHPEVVALAPTAAPAGRETFPLEVPLTARPGETRILADLQLFYCQTGKSGLCLIKTLRLSLPVKVTPESSSHHLEVSYQVQAP